VQAGDEFREENMQQEVLGLCQALYFAFWCCKTELGTHVSNMIVTMDKKQSLRPAIKYMEFGYNQKLSPLFVFWSFSFFYSRV